jgi:aryl-alcohol dehydrogenase-like predicted oxidoreductase
MFSTQLGNTGLKISRLCFGTEPFNFKKGPEGDKTQGDKTPEEGGQILAEALELGVNFWDTSDDYGTHPHVADALTRVQREDVVVADKTNALTYDEGRRAVEISLSDLGTDYIDLMFLHIVPAVAVNKSDAIGRPYYSGTLMERFGAIQAFLEAKESGTIRAIAMSTHDTRVLRQVAEVSEIDVVCTTLNKYGTFMEGGTVQEHILALKELKKTGKGIYVIKLLAAGRLRAEADSAIKFAFQYHDFIDAWNIGMYDLRDVRKNLNLLSEVLY